jgi:hypothetical protein
MSPHLARFRSLLLLVVLWLILFLVTNILLRY